MAHKSIFEPQKYLKQSQYPNLFKEIIKKIVTSFIILDVKNLTLKNIAYFNDRFNKN